MNRPQVTKELIAAAAAKLAEGEGWDNDQAADVAKVYHHHMDGYELAKALERECVWPISVADVEALDGMSHEVRKMHRQLCMEWVQVYKIEPPLPIGAMTTQGEITGIYEHEAACYLIRKPGDTEPTRQYIVRFEDARLLQAPSVASA